MMTEYTEAQWVNAQLRECGNDREAAIQQAQAAHARVAALEAERDALAEKLARAVKAAFYEGFYEGNEGGRVSPAWKQSDALAELKGQNDE